MHQNSAHVISYPMCNRGLKQSAEMEQAHSTAQRTLDSIKGKDKNCPCTPLLSCTQHFDWRFQLLGIGTTLIPCAMVDFRIKIAPCCETMDTSCCRSKTLSLDGCRKRAYSFLGYSKNGFIHEAKEANMESDRHLEIRRNFSSLDDPFSMSLSPLKEKFLSIEDPNSP